MRILITGSADGLGRLAAAQLMREGHDVVVHVRRPDRLDAVADITSRGAMAWSAIWPMWVRCATSPSRRTHWVACTR